MQGILSGQAKTKNQLNAIKAVEKIEMLIPFEDSQKNTHAAGGTNEDH